MYEYVGTVYDFSLTYYLPTAVPHANGSGVVGYMSEHDLLFMILIAAFFLADKTDNHGSCRRNVSRAVQGQGCPHLQHYCSQGKL